MYELIRSNIESKIDRKMSDEDFGELIALTQPMNFQKKEVLVREGQYCNHLYYVNKGLIYSSYTGDKGLVHVVQIAVEDFWISDLYGFFSGNRAICDVKALEDTSVVAISKDNLEKACETIPLIEHFFRKLIQNAYISSHYRMTQTKSAEAKIRYLDFLDAYPTVSQRIPQYLIASFLGIQPQSLSRIRRSLLHTK